MFYDLTVIGAGAAGLFAAINAAKKGLKVCLIDSAEKLCEKIRISGGGRCNFTNLYASPENYISQNPHFCKSAFSNFGPEDFIKLISEHKIKFHEKKLGQLFCDDGSQAMIDFLLKEAEKYNVKIIHPCKITDIKIDVNFDCFAKGLHIKSKSLIISTGGLSIPKIGASDFGHRFAESLGIKVVNLAPALVPLTCSELLLENLSGTSFDALVSKSKQAFRENVLCTHQGLSGPAILQISSYLNSQDEINLDLCPDHNLENILYEAKKGSKQQVKTILSDLKHSEESKQNLKNKIVGSQVLPEKFIDKLADKYNLSKKIAECSNLELKEIADNLKKFKLKITGNLGYDKAEVTRGGVDTNSLDSKTMMVKDIPGLYFIGEVVDVTGWLGGYNFQWAWSSAYVAASSL